MIELQIFVYDPDNPIEVECYECCGTGKVTHCNWVLETEIDCPRCEGKQKLEVPFDELTDYVREAAA